MGSSSERSTGSSSEQSEQDAATGGGPNGPPRESEAERTAVIANPIAEPIHGRLGGPGGDGEQAGPNGLFTSGGLAGAPPWQREGADTDGATVGATVAEEPPPERTYAFSDGPPPDMADAPTSYVERFTAPTTDEETEYFRSRLRTAEPTFQQPAPSEAPRPAASARVRSNRAPRRASLQIKRFDPWSVLKLSLVLSVAGFLVWLVAVGVLYGVLEGMGVWDQLNGTYSDLTSVTDPQAGGDLISGGRVFAFATVVGAINIVLLTALATVGAFIYNVSSDLAGGIELTLSERD